MARPHNETDRYIHDIEQAIAMRQRKKPQSPSSCSSTTTTSMAEAVALGLQGLDEADALRQQGEEQCAFELYQSAIEVMVHLLRDEQALRRIGYDKETLTERTCAAMSDAEELKKIMAGGTQQTTCEASSEGSLSPMKKTCFSKIKEYLASLSHAAMTKAVPAPANSKAFPRQQLSRSQVSSIRKPAITGSSTAQTRITTNKSNAIIRPTYNSNNNSSIRRIQNNPNITNKINSPQPQPQKQVRNEEDLFRKTVMEDMYVPSSQLQSTTWDDISGLASAKQALQEAAIMPLVRPDLFTGLRKPQNILLYGAPGTGKTLLVKAVACESQCSLFLCTASAITSKWHGDSEKLVRALFSVARGKSPSIIFLDELDALLGSRKSEGEHEASRRFKTEFMVQMDGINPSSNTNSNNGHSVLLVACTNCPWDIDSAILRRFPRRIFVPLPDKEARKALFKALLKKAGKHSLSKSEISDLVKRLKGFSGSDIQSIASEASFGPLRSVGSIDSIRSVRAKDVRPISAEDFEKAIKQATKSVTKEQLAKYEEWKHEQGAS